MLRLFTWISGCDFDIICGGNCDFRDMGFKVGKCTLDEKSCLEMGSYDTPWACGIP